MSPCNRNTREQENQSQRNTFRCVDLHKRAAGTLTQIAVPLLGFGLNQLDALPPLARLMKRTRGQTNYTFDSINERFGFIEVTWMAELSRVKAACLGLPSMKVCVIASAGLASL